MITAVAAVVRERGGPVSLADLTLPAPGAREIVVKVMASGVCPTDMFGIDGGAGERYPAVFGHEGAGVVEAVGSGVTGFRPGDRVVLGFASCRACGSCLDGHPAYCERFTELNYAARLDSATAGPPGGDAVITGWMGQSSWATRVVVDAASAVAIGPDLPWAVAAALGCGVLTGAGAVLSVLRPGPGDTLLVLGAGTTGLAAVMAARHRGVRRIIASDPVPSRRELALTLGATEAVAPEEVGRAVVGPSATHVLDTVGTQGTLDTALSALAPRGTCATVALKPGANRLTLSQSRLLWGRTITGVIEGDADIARDVPMLAALWRAGRLPVEALITEYAFAEVEQAVAAARSGRAIKAVLQMSEPDVAPRADPGAPRPGALHLAAPGDLLHRLRSGGVDEEDLPNLWRSLAPVAPQAMLGLWRGTGLSPGHPAHRLLTGSNWFGKRLRTVDDIAPIVCTTDTGDLVADRGLARGGARLIWMEHDGVRTAAMAYDGRPIIDCFVALSADAVLGVMTGRDAVVDGRAYHFLLERIPDREVREQAAAG